MSTILMYHYLGPDPGPNDPHRGLFVPPEEFSEQLRALRALKRRTVTPEEYSEGLDSGGLHGAVWLTFDDGRRDNYEAAFRLLREAEMKATFFVVVEKCLGGHPEHMDAGMLREMVAEGMSIGSHSLTHPRLARIDADQLRSEIADSKHRLEDALGVEISSFCYPYGNWNKDVVEMVRDAGYRLAVSTIRDNRNTNGDRWTLKRAMVQPGRTGHRFRHLFGPVYHWVHSRKNRRRWTSGG